MTYYAMPMQLSKGTLLQVLLGARDIMTLREIRSDLFPYPATIEYVRLGIRESPFQVRDVTVVPILLAQVIRVLQVNGLVCATWELLATKTRVITDESHSAYLR